MLQQSEQQLGMHLSQLHSGLLQSVETDSDTYEPLMQGQSDLSSLDVSKIGSAQSGGSDLPAFEELSVRSECADDDPASESSPTNASLSAPKSEANENIANSAPSSVIFSFLSRFYLFS